MAYGALIPPKAPWASPTHGWINLHFSLLPAWRGAAPVQHSVINGDEVTGASTFLLEKGLDTGPVYGTMTEAIRPADTSAELLERLSHSGAVLLAQTIGGLEAGALTGVPQQGEITLAPKLTLEDGHVRWSDPALAIDRRVRGVTSRTRCLDHAGRPALQAGARCCCVRTSQTWPPRSCASRPKSVLVGTGSHAVELVDCAACRQKTYESNRLGPRPGQQGRCGV